jgi:hypothetical protein
MNLSNKSLRVNKAITYIHKTGYKYPVEKRIELISRWLALGNMRQAAAMCNIDYELCKKWKREPWFADMVAEIQAARKLKTDNKLNKIIDKALDLIEDRLDNGDFIHNQKTGEVYRKQVSLKEARGAANDLMQRQVALSKLEIEQKSSDTAATIADQLTFLKQQFAAFNTNRTIEVTPNALDEEREKGLQKRIPSLPGEGRPDSQSLGAEHSEGDSEEGWDGRSGEGRGPQEASEQGWDEFSEQPEGSEQDDQPELFEKFQFYAKESTE